MLNRPVAVQGGANGEKGAGEKNAATKWPRRRSLCTKGEKKIYNPRRSSRGSSAPRGKWEM